MLCKLTILNGPRAGQHYEFVQSVIRIGRDPSSDMAYDPHVDLLVSANHAKIVLMDKTPVLFDLDSTNGTFVNGKQVARQNLIGGEILEFGRGGPKVRMSFGEEEIAKHSNLKKPVSAATVMAGSVPLVELSLGEADLLSEHTLDDRLTIGRSSDCDIVLDSMYVSNLHSLIEKQNETVYLIDQRSANGTYLDGERITEAVLHVGSEFAVGPYLFKYIPNKILVFDTRAKTWVEAHNLCCVDAKTKRNFLENVSLKIQPGELVYILGPSGGGKSTLIKALNGYSPADTGSVFLNNIDFYKNYKQLKYQVGYVPQDDIIHPQLTVERTLRYAAKLRLPVDTPKEKREERIKDVLFTLELIDHRKKQVSKLSGGQRKRVSIGVELLTEPAVLFLDEPTSGLDPHLEEKMMLLLREIALRGKTVVAVTHTLDHVHLADKVGFLVDGKLVFLGTHKEAQEFFKVEKLFDVYKRFEERKGNIDSLRLDFEASSIYEKHIGKNIERKSDKKNQEVAAKRKSITPGFLKQFFVLTQRYTEILTRDTRNTAILFLQAPLVALFICLAVKSDQPEQSPTSTMLLIMSLSALWFGCSNAAREFTKEASIFARERMVHLRIISYVASKFFVLQWLALFQVTTMLIIVLFLRPGYVIADPPHECVKWGINACSLLILEGVPGDFWLHLLNLYLTALNGIGFGLLVSSLVSNSDKAMSLVPLLLIPQVLFSGSFGVVQSNDFIKRGVGYAMALNWSLDQSKRIAMCSTEQESPKEKASLGCSNCIHAYDPLKYRRINTENQIDDSRCEAVIPVASQMFEFPESLQVIEDGFYTPFDKHNTGPARQATKSFIGLIVLGGYDLLLFVFVCLFVGLKNRKREK